MAQSRTRTQPNKGYYALLSRGAVAPHTDTEDVRGEVIKNEAHTCMHHYS